MSSAMTLPLKPITLEDLRLMKDKDRLDFLSDPANEFHYSISQDGRCNLGWRGTDGSFKDLRTAIDDAIEKKRQST
jgi:hypothetical protein